MYTLYAKGFAKATAYLREAVFSFPASLAKLS